MCRLMYGCMKLLVACYPFSTRSCRHGTAYHSSYTAIVSSPTSETCSALAISLSLSALAVRLRTEGIEEQYLSSSTTYA